MPLVMLPAALTKGSDLLITSADRQAILERLYQRQAIRREVGVRPINIPVMYERKKRMIAEARYDEIMQPYVDEAFSSLVWPDSFSGRLLLGVKTYNLCVARCERDTGHANPREGVPDILKLIHQYVEPLS
ncbi:MAG: hypothetical protein AAGA12_02855 [Pseudomonadota bacterium]